MGLLDSVITDDGAVFVDSDGFGESVVYLKGDGTTRSISATVFRLTPDDLQGAAERTRIRRLELEVRNSATLGITPGELDLGKDRLQVAWRRGETATNWAIMQILSQDAGMVRLLLR
jgi:hypothetical protein